MQVFMHIQFSVCFREVPFSRGPDSSGKKNPAHIHIHSRENAIFMTQFILTEREIK